MKSQMSLLKYIKKKEQREQAPQEKFTFKAELNHFYKALISQVQNTKSEYVDEHKACKLGINQESLWFRLSLGFEN